MCQLNCDRVLVNLKDRDIIEKLLIICYLFTVKL